MLAIFVLTLVRKTGVLDTPFVVRFSHSMAAHTEYNACTDKKC